MLPLIELSGVGGSLRGTLAVVWRACEQMFSLVSLPFVLLTLVVVVVAVVLLRSRSRDGVVAGAPNNEDGVAPPNEVVLVSRLAEGRNNFLSRLRSLFVGAERGQSREVFAAELEELLLSADLGVRTTEEIVREVITSGADNLLEASLELARSVVLRHLTEARDSRNDQIVSGMRVVLVVGVNGVGKTTSVAKLAHLYKKRGQKVLVAAADTFRAAAVAQLVAWAEKLSLEVHVGPDCAKPATVAFGAVERGLSGQFDVVIVDTAGRLHNRANLMQELQGVCNALAKKLPGAPHETLLVVDGNSGQNALVQAREFQGVIPLSGVVITKLDGTARGGIVVAISKELRLPVRFVGLGEGEDDLIPFDPESYVTALFGPRPDSVQSRHGQARLACINAASS